MLCRVIAGLLMQNNIRKGLTLLVPLVTRREFLLTLSVCY